MSMPKRIPLRQCLGCREMKAKKELVRVVRSPGGTVSVDLRGKAPGRGAYVCPNPVCLKKALRSKALSRSLEVEIPPEIYDTLTAQMEEANGPDNE
ncbi:MAG: YlxR family protein [Oscillospiraceae bacterium]|nr:YlxR family protein [Oscillospiraceae bacterium]